MMNLKQEICQPVDFGFNFQSGKTMDYRKIGMEIAIHSFSVGYSAIKRDSVKLAPIIQAAPCMIMI